MKTPLPKWVRMARCAVRAACSGATLQVNNATGLLFRPLRRGRGHRSAMFLPALSYLSALFCVTPNVDAVLFRLPLASNAVGHYYFDHSAPGYVSDWKCQTETYDGHTGTDFGAPRYTAIYSAAVGTLAAKQDGWGDGSLGTDPSHANYVIVNHSGGMRTLYWHMQIWTVTTKGIGAGIACGEQIGQVGNSGMTSGPHLHFEPQLNNVPDDPYAGSCGGPTSWWVNQNGGNPVTTCEGGTIINPPYLFGTGVDGWTAGSNLTVPWWTATGWPGVLVTDQIGGDAYMHSPAVSFAGGYDTSVNVHVYPQNGTTAGHDMQFFWKTTAEDSWTADKASPMIGFTAKDSWIRVNLDVNNPKWIGQTLKQLRLDFDQNNQGVRWIVNHIYPQNTPKWWLDSGNTAGWTLGNSLSGLAWTACCGWPGIMYADQTGPDAYFYGPAISYLGGANDKLFVKVFPQNGNTANHQIKVYWTTASDNTWTESKSSETVYFTAQNAWADLGIRVGANVNWYSDFVTKIRLDVDDVVNTSTRWIIDYIAIVPQTQQQTIAPVPDIIIDNPAASVTGTWTTGSSATDKYGADYRYKSKGTGAAYLQYTPSIVNAGKYKVYEFHPKGSNRTTVAPHLITFNGGSQTVNVNQQVNGGAWNLLGTFTFATGTAGNIRIKDNFTDTGSIVIADAIKLVYVP